jgi:hypothetical protein
MAVLLAVLLALVPMQGALAAEHRGAPEQILYQNEAFYVGQLTNGQFDGFGMFMQPQGEGNNYFYMGQWSNGLRDGWGIVVSKDGAWYEGLFRYNALVEGSQTSAETTYTQDIEEGVLTNFELINGGNSLANLVVEYNPQTGDYYIGEKHATITVLGFELPVPHRGLQYTAQTGEVMVGKFLSGVWQESLPALPAQSDPSAALSPALPNVPQPQMGQFAPQTADAALQSQAAAPAAAMRALPTLPPHAVTLPPLRPDPTPRPTLPDEYFTATIDGMAFVFEAPEAATKFVPYTLPNESIAATMSYACNSVLVGGQTTATTSNAYAVFLLRFADDLQAGYVYTHNTRPSDYYGFSFSLDQGSRTLARREEWTASSFTLQITSRDGGCYAGTLEAVLKNASGDEITLTNGEFFFSGRYKAY